MVAALHKKKLGVVMDVVFNHTLASGPENPKSLLAGACWNHDGSTIVNIAQNDDGSSKSTRFTVHSSTLA